MATKPSVSGDTATAESDVDTTLLDVQSAAVKRLIAKGKERGYVTFDDLNLVLPSEQNSSEQIEDVMAQLNEWASKSSRARKARTGSRRPLPSRKRPRRTRKSRPATSTRRASAAPTIR